VTDFFSTSNEDEEEGRGEFDGINFDCSSEVLLVTFQNDRNCRIFSPANREEEKRLNYD